MLLIRRSDGTTQYLRPVTSGTGTPGAYRAVRTTQVQIIAIHFFTANYIVNFIIFFTFIISSVIPLSSHY